MLDTFRCFGKLSAYERERGTAAARVLPLLCATLAVGLGLMTFVGWTSGLSILASVRAKYIPMAPSTALCFSLLGIGITIQTVRPSVRWVPRVLSVAVLAFACAKLMEFLGGINFGIDAWFVRNPGKFGAVPTGRMSPITALNLLFTATALLALASNRFRKLAGTLGALATVIAIVVLIRTRGTGHGNFADSKLQYVYTIDGEGRSRHALH